MSGGNIFVAVECLRVEKKERETGIEPATLSLGS